MDPLEHLRERISRFPGYDVDIDRRRSDELVRSYLGEALAEIGVRCTDLSSELRDRIEGLLLRVGFSTPKSFSLHDGHLGVRSSDGNVPAVDAATVDIADRAPAIPCDAIAAYLDDVIVALDARDAAMRAAAAQT